MRKARTGRDDAGRDVSLFDALLAGNAAGRRFLVVDNFAGGGGASQGIREGFRPVDLAINHNRLALEMHQANHPEAVHVCEDVWTVDQLERCKGLPIGLAWFSPDCKHFSRAKGSKPVEKKIRGLAWVVVRWAKRKRPHVIILENVREFLDWGPLLENNMPDPDRKGLTFRRWAGCLRNMGYHLEWRVLNAADYGVPTHRRRLFVIARCDGQPIVWPEPTHGPGRLPYRTAGECIDWSIEAPSIFGRKRDLAAKTLTRITMGLRRYVLDDPQPYIVQVNHGRDPFRGQAIHAPLGTITGKHGWALVIPHLVSGYGEAPGQEPRTSDVRNPMPAVVATPKHALVSAFVTQFFGGMVGKRPDEPLPSITAIDHNAITTAYLVRICQNGSGGTNTKRASEPLTTVTSKAEHCAVAVYLSRFNHGDKQWNDVREPLGTITSQGNKFGATHASMAAFLCKYYGTGGQHQGLGEPLHTVTSRDRFTVLEGALVTVLTDETVIGAKRVGRLLVRQLQIDPLAAPAASLRKLKTKLKAMRRARAAKPWAPTWCNSGGRAFPLAVALASGTPHLVVGIGLRMLTPRELATAQGFPRDYVLTGSKSNQVEKIGNSVPPKLAEVLSRANRPKIAEDAAA